MKYEVKIRHMNDSGDGISIEAKIDGEPIAHTFHKDTDYAEIDSQTGRPKFVDKLVDLHEERKRKRRGDTLAEQAADKGRFENKVYDVER